MNLLDVGDAVCQTVNGWGSPGNVTLVHEDETVMLADYAFIYALAMTKEFFILRA